MATYKLITGSAAEAFQLSRAKVQMYGGGFANGKTTALCMKTLVVARDYPGANLLLARATYPKLNTTLRREFFKWLPPNWLKSFNKQENTAVLVNGSTIDFRYIDQQKSAEGESTSNLLSANYDFIGIDQIEDPEITQMDFNQLLGRLRGMTPYGGEDDTMPRTGPRMMAITCNPSIGWVYKHLVQPLHDLRNGRFNPNLLCEVDSEGAPVLVDGKPQPIIQVFEASTYENAQNLEADYIKTLEAAYRGKMRDRYLLGKWVAFEGVVYDEFDVDMHVVPQSFMLRHLSSLRMAGYKLGIIEGYDFGIASPSCYMLAFVDAEGCVYIVDGFYEREAQIDKQAENIRALRSTHIKDQETIDELVIDADPSIFKRTAQANKLVGKSVAQMFADEDISMAPGNNDIMNGIIKVKGHLAVQKTVLNPFSGEFGSPKLFVADHLHWFQDEITTWRWQVAKDDSPVDKPIDKNDHAMDTLKYMLSRRPTPAKMAAKRPAPLAKFRTWGEAEAAVRDTRGHRYG